MLHDLDIDCEMPEDMIEKRLKKVEEKEKRSALDGTLSIRR